MDKGDNASLLIRGKDKHPEHSRSDDTQKHHESEMLLRDTRDKDHSQPNSEDHYSPTEIWLQKNQYENKKRVGTRDKNMPQVFYLDMSTGEIF